MILGLLLFFIPAQSFSENFNYNYIQLNGNLIRTEQKFAGRKPVFKGRGLGISMSFTPVEHVYVQTGFSRLTVDDSDSEKGVKVSADGEETSYGAIAGIIVPLGAGVDLRLGGGARRSEMDFDLALNGGAPENKDREETDFVGEAALRIGLDVLGDLDLIYNRVGDDNVFTVGGVGYLWEGVGLEIGYTYIPKLGNSERFESWNLGLRFEYL